MRRSRCLGYIINLAAKAFLLRTDCEAFSDSIAMAEQAAIRDEKELADLQAKWRKRGPVGKFHNVVAYIRAFPQRRQEFAKSVEVVIAQAKQDNKKTRFTLALLY